MRILLLVHGFNALSQRIYVELSELGHQISVEFDVNDETTKQAVQTFSPDVILAPYLKRPIAPSIWRNHLCLIVHPGPVGDRGPSAVDWMILKGAKRWGVTVLQAVEEMDAGPVWSTAEFVVSEHTKSSIYRNEVTVAAVVAVKSALAKIEEDEQPQPQFKGIWQNPIKQSDRAIDWVEDDTQTVLRKIRCADGVPGVRDEIFGQTVFLYDGREAGGLVENPGEIIAVSGPAIARATRDGAIWIGHLKRQGGDGHFKLPANQVLGDQLKDRGLLNIPIDSENGYREIRYTRTGDVGHLWFEFYNGAMGTEQCERLLRAYRNAKSEDTKVIVLHGGHDFWSNGMHLNKIEASSSPADESWRNINAIDDIAEEIIRTDSHITIAALHGNVGAGGVFLARACDHVWMRNGVVLNPHYKDMGNLYGSEFWTYLLPRYCGAENAKRITQQRLPMGSREAVELKLVDRAFGKTHLEFDREVEKLALAECVVFKQSITNKIKTRAKDEATKPLSEYRDEELSQMRRNFFGFDPSYHVARYNFVLKVVKSRTPITLAHHRDQRHSGADRAAVERKAS